MLFLKIGFLYLVFVFGIWLRERALMMSDFRGGGGVKNHRKSSDIIYARSLSLFE